MIITTLGWLWIGIIVGATVGIVWSTVYHTKEIRELEDELQHLKWVRESLKDEIFRLDNQVKPKPRSKRRGK